MIFRVRGIMCGGIISCAKIQCSFSALSNVRIMSIAAENFQFEEVAVLRNCKRAIKDIFFISIYSARLYCLVYYVCD